MMYTLGCLISVLAALTTKIDRLTVKLHKAKHVAIEADLINKVNLAKSVLEVYEERQKQARITLNLATCDVYTAEVELGRATHALNDFVGE